MNRNVCEEVVTRLAIILILVCVTKGVGSDTMMDPVFALRYSIDSAHFKTLSAQDRKACRLKAKVKYWIYGEFDSYKVIAGRIPGECDGTAKECKDVTSLEPGLGEVFTVRNGICKEMDVDRVLFLDSSDKSDDRKFISLDSQAKLAGNIIESFIAAFGGVESFSLALKRESVKTANLPPSIVHALKKRGITW